MPIKIIDNFSGRLSRDDHGDLNSGFAKYETTFGSNPFINPGNLTWFEQPTSILSTNNGGIVATKVRLESDETFVYAVSGESATVPTLYKITVNNSGTKNANLDSPSVIGAIPTETSSTIGVIYGPSMQFYGTTISGSVLGTERIFLGSDERITKINFDGSSATRLTAISSIIVNVPRPSAQFLGKMYFGNGNNLIEIDSTETVTSYAKLNPGFPIGTFVRDLDVTPDGNYLQIIVSKNNSVSLSQLSADYQAGASQDAYKFLWNGTDLSYTSYETYPGYSLTANTVFGQNNYTLGTDMNGVALYDGAIKIITLPNLNPPNFGATYSTGNLFGLMSPEYNSSVTGGSSSSVVGLQGASFLYGQYDNETPRGFFRIFRQSAASGNNEVLRVPVCLPVSNLVRASQGTGYANNISSSAKIYFSTIEHSGGNIKAKLYKFFIVPTGTGTAIGGVYETQRELFSKKIKPSQVRFYVEPLVANNSFQIDIIGSDGYPMSGGTQTFTAGSGDVAVGDDFVWYTPQTNPTYCMGFRITNLGAVNWTGVKLEVDYEKAGQ